MYDEGREMPLWTFVVIAIVILGTLIWVTSHNGTKEHYEACRHKCADMGYKGWSYSPTKARCACGSGAIDE